MFVTAVYGVLSIENGEFTYANAGHNPPVWMRNAGKTLELLHRTGPALGIIEDLSMDQRTITLGREDLLFLYTDGLTEAFSQQGEIFGEERLQLALKLAGTSSTRQVLDAMEASVNKFMDPIPAADDLTMLALKRVAKR
jgi:serine phosphatase RsbU (regulator of sigma subunit)